ncbi:TrmH family RNA methyltransferase [Thermoanaerobacterium thermosaccharolyticum]|uniref:TrmH family RNA methyltransferase n=1 Tax=Thermoanaerobacterium thermosaccharolyticum TaxID=1517 RepID=UPI00123A30AA|nr:RNA methyltransferase [Thermoanaerobacterium thermosaccharolyticum]KAA5807296.1 RNA methyltransferase [Thermoanaerobacterium thermosaccharolyticum]
MLITSEKNDLIKDIKKLSEKKYRYEKKLFFVEGKNSVFEALKSGFEIKYVLVSEDCDIDLDVEKDRLIFVDKGIFKKISDTVTPQMIMAVVKMPDYNVNDLIKEDGLYIILDEVQDPGNLGTIIRSADAFNVDAVFTINNTVDVYNPKALRSTMGSIFHLPVVNDVPVDKLFEALKRNGVRVLSTNLKAEKYIYDCDISKNIALIFGNESRGVNKSLDIYVDGSFKIPMDGMAESLNVSVAASICLYESQRQRLIK